MAGAPLEFGGQENFDAPPERLFDLITDLDSIAETIPDVVSSGRTGDDQLECTVKPGFSFLRGTLTLTITVAERRRPERAVMHVLAKGIGATIEVESELDIAADGGGSQLDWSARVTKLSGLVATVSRSLIKAAADQTIRDVWPQVRQRLDG